MTSVFGVYHYERWEAQALLSMHASEEGARAAADKFMGQSDRKWCRWTGGRDEKYMHAAPESRDSGELYYFVYVCEHEVES